jgi:hypothetical protein
MRHRDIGGTGLSVPPGRLQQKDRHNDRIPVRGPVPARVVTVGAGFGGPADGRYE